MKDNYYCCCFRYLCKSVIICSTISPKCENLLLYIVFLRCYSQKGKRVLTCQCKTRLSGRDISYESCYYALPFVFWKVWSCERDEMQNPRVKTHNVLILWQNLNSFLVLHNYLDYFIPPLALRRNFRDAKLILSILIIYRSMY